MANRGSSAPSSSASSKRPQRARVSRRMHCNPELPTEIVLIIQGFLPLQSLIKARSVCQLWRSLIPGSHIPSARRALLELYLRAINSRAFEATRAEVQSQQRPFNRAKLLASIKGPVPEEFRCWVLEWPARAAIGQIWPNLRHPEHRNDSPATLHKGRGKNLLYCDGMNLLNTLRLNKPSPGYMETVPYRSSCLKDANPAYALLLDDAYVEGWQRSHMLVLSGKWGGMNLAGSVYQVDGVHCRLDKPYAKSWVAFLQLELEREESWLQEHKR